MLTVKTRPEIEGIVREKLRERLRFLKPDCGNPSPLCRSPLDPEESLRQLMVRYRPRLASRSLHDEDIRQVLDVASSVAANATMRDLRFIDALNATYEVWSNGYRPEIRNAFVCIYRTALISIVES
jgi:hypothetical protein